MNPTLARAGRELDGQTWDLLGEEGGEAALCFHSDEMRICPNPDRPAQLRIVIRDDFEMRLGSPVALYEGIVFLSIGERFPMHLFSSALSNHIVQGGLTSLAVVAKKTNQWVFTLGP